MLYEIKHRFTNNIICSFESENLRKGLEDKVISGADLYRADLYRADLRGADLREANLREANLYGANLYGADLREADLYGADLRGANLYGADLREANLYGADLREANLYGADLRGEILEKTPIFITGMLWDITITKKYLTISCQRHSHEEWENFKDVEISEMAGSALSFWTLNKNWILEACKSHREEV